MPDYTKCLLALKIRVVFEHRTLSKRKYCPKSMSNVEARKDRKMIEDSLIDFTLRIIRMAGSLPKTTIGCHPDVRLKVRWVDRPFDRWVSLFYRRPH